MIAVNVVFQCFWFESQQVEGNLGIQWQPGAGELQISHTLLPINSADVLWMKALKPQPLE